MKQKNCKKKLKTFVHKQISMMIYIILTEIGTTIPNNTNYNYIMHMQYKNLIAHDGVI